MPKLSPKNPLPAKHLYLMLKSLVAINLLGPLSLVVTVPTIDSELYEKLESIKQSNVELMQNYKQVELNLHTENLHQIEQIKKDHQAHIDSLWKDINMVLKMLTQMQTAFNLPETSAKWQAVFATLLKWKEGCPPILEPPPPC